MFLISFYYRRGSLRVKNEFDEYNVKARYFLIQQFLSLDPNDQ